MELPLVFGGEALGVLGVVESRRDRRFTEEEKQLLRLLARPAATAIGNARLFRQQQEQARRLSRPARREPGARRVRGPGRGAHRRRSAGGRGGATRPTPPSTSTGGTTTRSSIARSTRPARAAGRARRPPGYGVPACGLSRASGRSWRRPRRCRSTSRTPALPRTGAGPWRRGGRRPASAYRCASGGAAHGILRLTTTEEERRFTAARARAARGARRAGERGHPQRSPLPRCRARRASGCSSSSTSAAASRRPSTGAPSCRRWRRAPAGCSPAKPRPGSGCAATDGAAGDRRRVDEDAPATSRCRRSPAAGPRGASPAERSGLAVRSGRQGHGRRA